MKNIWIYIFIVISLPAGSQAIFNGLFRGLHNGEDIILKLNQVNAKEVQGVLSDASSNYDVRAEIAGNRFAGDALHTSLGLKPAILGELKNDVLSIILLFEIAGDKTEVKVDLKKESADAPSVTISNLNLQIPKNAGNDIRIVGTWVKEEIYNSGGGDNFMGSAFSQSLTFFNDGSVADGGSAATISGGNFFGQSQQKESHKTPGVVWYTRSNQLFLGVVEQGTQQEVALGRFYIENGNMLITGSNGTKMLLRKK